MSNISNKISGIEPEDDVAVKGSGLRPSDDDIMDIPKSSILEPVNSASKPKKPQDPVPQFITRSSVETSNNAASQFGWIKWVTVSMMVLWVILSVVITFTLFKVGASGTPTTPLTWVGIGLFIVLPLCLIGLLGFALGRLSMISLDSARLRHTAERLMSPDDTAMSRASLMSQYISTELDNVNQRVDAALSRTAKLSDILDTHVQALNQTTQVADNRTTLIAERLKEERDALVSISTTYDDRMSALSKMLDTHSANLARSTQEAEQKIQEARISVEGVASKINLASEIVRENTVEAASNLDANQKEIIRLGQDLKTRAEELEAVYGNHTTDLAKMISDLKAEQENLGVTLDARLKKMRDMSLSAQVSAQHLTDASEAGRHTVETLAGAARLADSAVKKRFSEMEEMVKFSNSRAEKISETAARRVQESLAQTRKEISRIEYDMVALQDRLKNAPQQESEPDIEPDLILESPMPEPKPVPQPAPKKRRGILGLRPAAEDPAIEETVTAKAPEISKPQVDDRKPEPRSELSAEPNPLKLKGLRPAPTQEAPQNIISQNITSKPSPPQDELSIPPLDMDTPVENAPDIVTEPVIEAAPQSLEGTQERDPNTLELTFDIPQASDLTAPDPDHDIKTFDPDMLRSVVTNTRSPKEENEKQSWWKGMFGVGKKDEGSALDQLVAPTPTTKPAPENLRENLQENPQPAAQKIDIISSLTALGLTPSAIVDAGCIIEAVNARVSKGPLAMSDVIMHRLDEPVRHLYQSAEADPNLKDTLISFARDFHTGLGPFEDNREAIRTRLESDEGRAFLLCDAALNI